jgi:RNA polymerase sigma-70 factor (ECF subfamily)
MQDVIGSHLDKAASRFQATLLRHSFALCRNSDMARDLSQNVWLRAASRPGIAGEACSFRAWLFKVARNLMVDSVRSRKPLVPFEPGSADEDGPSLHLPCAGLAPDEEAIRGEVASILWDEVSRLPDHVRTVCLLHYAHELTLVEVAGRLGIPIGTVRSRLNRALTSLRCSLAVRLNRPKSARRLRRGGEVQLGQDGAYPFVCQ